MSTRVKNARRIVVKIGTSILTTREGLFSRRHLALFCRDVQELVQQGKEVVLVSSGAIGLGMGVAKMKRRPKRMAQLQACAAIGQGKLMHAYESFFSKSGMHTAQLLLTRDGLEMRSRFLRASQTLHELLRLRVIPIVNENDTVSTEEIAFGDNDILSVYAAHLVKADLLVILSDVDGFFLKDGSRIRQVNSRKQISSELTKHIADRRKERTVGGMRAKLRAASQSMAMGIPLLMVNGHRRGVLKRALKGDDLGTLFLPEKSRKSSREMWISFTASRQGTIVVDSGAYEALSTKKRSLLPKGILRVRGSFEKGQVVELETAEGRVFGRGVARYAGREITQLTGKRTDEIESILGYKSYDEVIHRNDMVLWD